MNEREANQMLSVYASYIRAGNAKEAGELATKIVRLLAAAGMSAEGGSLSPDSWPSTSLDETLAASPKAGESRTQVEQRQEGVE